MVVKSPRCTSAIGYCCKDERLFPPPFFHTYQLSLSFFLSHFLLSPSFFPHFQLSLSFFSHTFHSLPFFLCPRVAFGIKKKCYFSLTLSVLPKHLPFFSVHGLAFGIKK